MKIKSQALILSFAGILTITLLGGLVRIQLKNGETIAREMVQHQSALIQLNNFQVSAIKQILLSVDLVRTGDISGERITAYRMSETGFTRAIRDLESLYSLGGDLTDEIRTLKGEGEALSELCRTKLLDPLYSHQNLEEGIIEQLIYKEMDNLTSRINGIRKGLDDRISSDLIRQEEQQRKFSHAYLPASAGVLLLLLGLCLAIIARALKHINRTRYFLGNLAEGTLSLDEVMAERGSDEISQLRRNFNRFMENLRQRYTMLKGITLSIVRSGEELNLVSQEHAAASLQLEQNLNNMSSQSEDLSRMVHSSHGEISRIDRSLHSLEELARTLDDEVTTMVGRGEDVRENLGAQQRALEQQVELTRRVNEASRENYRRMELLSRLIGDILEQSRGIAESIVTIQDLADKTDLLAINASIEAAHSGHMGKGFSVVAQEMRHLSSEVRRNTSLVGSLLNELNGRIALMSGEEEEGRLSQESLFRQNSRAESAIEELRNTGLSIEGVLSTFTGSLQIVRSGSSDLHRNTEELKRGSLAVMSLMNELESNQTSMLTESHEMTRGIEQFTRGTKRLEELSGENEQAAVDLELELGKLGF